jgi:hypothetical protein
MDYRNPAECLDLLKRLNPVNIDETQSAISDMVGGLLQGSAPLNQHLEVLETARETITLVQGEMARRYATHSLPPDGDDNATLKRVVSLWRKLADSYAEITRRDATSGTLDDQRALLAQRRVHYKGLALIEYFRAHRAVPTGMWAELHESFSMAEAQGVADIRVADALNQVWRAQSATEAFISFLLVDLSNPFGRGEREFNWICRWAQRFAPYCSLLGAKDADPAVKPTSYGIDLAADHGLRPIGVLSASSRTLRRFDGSRLAGQIQAVLGQLKQGVTPASLGLGTDCASAASAKLFLSLYRPWGLASVGRRFPRRGGRGQIELTADWLAIGLHVQGKLFEQPGGAASARSLRSDITLLTFGERADGRSLDDVELQRRSEADKLGFVCSRWDIRDQSVGGFRLAQKASTERLEHHQLVGVRPADGDHFLLGQISWLMFQDDGTLEAGVNMLNGIPRVVAARQVGVQGVARGAFQQAFALPETPALKRPESLVLPGGWFQPHRVIEIHDDGKARQLRLTTLLQRGANYDQVAYEAVTTPA